MGDGRLKTGDPKLVLASASPRRSELLDQAAVPFRVVVPRVEEQHQPHETATQYVARNADEKAAWVCEQIDLKDASSVLAADTVVVLEEHILEKPRDESDAIDMLTRLSGNAHHVLTGVSLFRIEDGTIVDRHPFVETTLVQFRSLSDEEIRTYVASGEPMDKAGAYAIQGLGGALVDHINGSYSNVVGLPIEHVLRILREWS